MRSGAPAATPNIVQYPAEIEGLVRLMEQTPRARCFEMLAVQLQAGASYRQLLAALFLAGIRNVNPQPPGFKLHCVFVIHSAHQLSLDAPLQERLLPLLWALDYFKQSQERDAAEGDFQLRDVVGPLPPAEKAWDEYHAAMESWDEPRADRAIAALVRTRGAHEVMEGHVALRCSRLSQHRPQGHLRREFVAHAADNRLAACRTDPSLPHARPAGLWS